MKKLLSVLLVALFLCTALFPSTGALTVAEESGSDAVPLDDNVLTDTSDTVNFPQYPNDGAVRIDKNVINTEIYNATGVAQIELTAAGIPINRPSDIVLVIDASGSMNKTTADGVNKFTAAKNAAKDFIATVTGNGSASNQHRIALVVFADAAETVMDLTLIDSASDLSSFNNAIGGLTYFAYGGTNYDDPLKLAGDILEAADSAGRKQVVVFMTDGAPGIYNRACPFYFHPYGIYGSSSAGNYRNKQSYLRNEVQLTVSEYFWKTEVKDNGDSAVTDTKYDYDLYDYKYKTGSRVVVPYVSGDSDTTDANGSKFAEFINTYWYDYVAGVLNPNDWSIQSTEQIMGGSGLRKVSSLSAGSYVLTTTDGTNTYVIGNEGDPDFATDYVTEAYPYLIPVTLTNEADGTVSITPVTGTISDYIVNVSASGSYWKIRNASTGNYFRYSGATSQFRPGWGVESTTTKLDLWQFSGGKLACINASSSYRYLNLSSDQGGSYLNEGSSSQAATFTFYRLPGKPIDPVPEEYIKYGNLAYYNGTSDNIFGARIKGTATQEQIDAWDIDGSPLNGTLYTIGFALDADDGGSRIDACASNPDGTANPIAFDYTQATAVLENMASQPLDGSKAGQTALNAANATDLKNAYAAIAESLVGSANNAVITDQMGAQFDLQLDSFVNTENGEQEISLDDPTIKVGTIEVGYYTLFESGDRRGERDKYVSLEELTWANYDAATNSLQGNYASYDFATETFTLNFELLAAQEISLRYWVHLEGSSEGEREAGIYDTNEYAHLDYTNHLGNDCRQTYPVPELPWGSAMTSYEYYLVNEQGQPINEQGQVVAFSERVIVGTTTDISFLLNSLQQVSGNGTVPEGYDMYNSSANYTVQANSDGTGEVFIYDSTGTTYVVAPNVDNTTDTKLDNLSGYTATTFSFAVVWEVAPSIELLPLGAQAHMIHQYEDLSLADNPALYTDGIRFGYTIDYGSMQKVLNEGDYFQTGMLLMPMSRINTAKDYATASSLDRAYMNSDYVNVAMMKLNVEDDGSFTAENGQPVFVAKLNGNQFPYATLNSGSMVQWTSAMDNAQSAEELAELLRAAGVVVFGTYRDQIRLMTYILFGGDANDDGRIHKAQRELVSRGYVVTLQNGEYTVYYAHQIANSAKRVWEHYNWDRYRVTERTGLLDRTEEEISRILLQGASRFAPTNQNTNQD